MISNPCDTSFRIDGKVALITGAASGIGLATSRLFSEKGAAVCMCDLNEDTLAKASEAIPGSEAFAMDVSDTASVDRAVKNILQRHGKIDVLINSAGVGDIDWAENLSERTWRKVIDINLSGTFYVSQCVGRSMIARGKGGKIISLASQAGLVAIDQHVAYSASKAGIISMMKSLAFEWGKYGIQANAISPTATETPIIIGYWDTGERHRKAIADTPAGRFCKPVEIACAALFLASDASNMVTGANLVVDGGYTIH